MITEKRHIDAKSKYIISLQKRGIIKEVFTQLNVTQVLQTWGNTWEMAKSDKKKSNK